MTTEDIRGKTALEESARVGSTEPKAGATQGVADATPGSILELSPGIAGRCPEGARGGSPDAFGAETIPEIVRELRSLGETHYSARIMAAWQRARHNFNVQLSTLRKKADRLRPNIKAVNKAVNETVNETVNKAVNGTALPLEKRETKEKKQKKEESKELPQPLTTSTPSRACAREEFCNLEDMESAAAALRPTEEQCIAAGITAGIPEETTRRWLEHMRQCDWHFSSGGIVTRANFRTSLIKWWAREKREAEAAKNGGAGQPERRYMTWQERAAAEREAAEEERQQWLIELSHQLKL